jgi:tRNA dimethylallyltransferase
MRHEATWFGLNWDREVLNQRINARVKQMMTAGWLDETRQLLEQGQLSQTAAEATGYAELIAHLQGRMKLDDAVEQIKIATRQLARRQMKWMRRFPNVTWLAGDWEVRELADAVQSSS